MYGDQLQQHVDMPLVLDIDPDMSEENRSGTNCHNKEKQEYPNESVKSKPPQSKVLNGARKSKKESSFDYSKYEAFINSKSTGNIHEINNFKDPSRRKNRLAYSIAINTPEMITNPSQDLGNISFIQRISNFSMYSSSENSASTPRLNSALAAIKSTGTKPEFARNDKPLPRSGSEGTFFSTRENKTNPNTEQSIQGSPIRRRNAIRVKTMKQFNALKKRIKRLLRIFNKFRFKNFKVSSKRICSKTKKAFNKTKNIKVTRGKQFTLRRSGSKLRNRLTKKLQDTQISEPYNSQKLGGFREQQMYNSYPNNRNYSSGVRSGADLFSSYMENQQERFTNHAFVKSRYNSIKYDGSQVIYKEMEPAGSILFESTLDRPPSPPQHTVFSNPALEIQSKDYLVDAWKSYLTNVLAKRIFLRQEISSFQKIAIQFSKPYNFTTPKAPYFEPKEYKDDIRTSLENEDRYSIDASEEFDRRYKRKSMLGEMLDYESSDDDSTSSNYSAADTVITNLGEDNTKKYQKIPSKEIYDFNDNYSIGLKPLRRSNGFQNNLHDLQY